MDPINLSDGTTTLPKGTFINLAAEAMSRDSSYYENPDEFDGYRWYRRWVSGGGGNQPLEEEFTGIEAGNVAWGNGRLTCPGRWYASALNKLILANLLVSYDLRFPDGQSTRPPNLYNDGGTMPDLAQLIFLRKRE